MRWLSMSPTRMFGAVAALQAASQLPPTEDAVKRLGEFLEVVESEDRRAIHPEAQKYYDAARTASNLTPYRKQRIDIMKQILLGQFRASADT